MTKPKVTVAVADGKVVLQHSDLTYPMTRTEVIELAARLIVFAGLCPEYQSNFSDTYFQVGKKMIDLTEALQALQTTYQAPDSVSVVKR